MRYGALFNIINRLRIEIAIRTKNAHPSSLNLSPKSLLLILNFRRSLKAFFLYNAFAFITPPYLFFSCFTSFSNNDFIAVFHALAFVWLWGSEAPDFSGDLPYLLLIAPFDSDRVFFHHHFNPCWNGVFHWVAKTQAQIQSFMTQSTL